MQKRYEEREILLPVVANTKDYVTAAILYMTAVTKPKVRKCDPERNEEPTTRLSENIALVKTICPHYRLLVDTNIYEYCIDRGNNCEETVNKIASHIVNEGLCKYN